MAVDIQKLVAAVVPDIYCAAEKRAEVKKIAKEKGYLAAAKEAKLVPQDEMFDIEAARFTPMAAKGLKAPYVQHKLVYDSPSESLEPIYFWILDFLNGPFRKVEKLVDNFVAAPGSSHFSEMGQKATRMQEEASKILGNVNTVLKSVLNIIYDLKEFKLRIETYDGYRNAKGPEKNAYLLALKQIWLDNVDIKRGNSSIKAMAQQYDYVTVIDGFMAVSDPELKPLLQSPEDGGIDLNERVRRILQQRLAEFFKWVDISEIELKKRFEIERKYLQSQVSALKLYARWVKPYLQAAQKLEQNATETAALVTTFNTLLLELSVLAQAPYDPADDVATGDLPDFFKTVTKKGYTACVLVDFKFRGIPQRSGQQGFTFGGRTEVSFFAFAFTEDELKVLKEELSKDNFKDVLGLIDGATNDSLAEIEKDIDDFLTPKKEEKKKDDKKEESDDINPFSALFSWWGPKKKDDKKDKDKRKKEIELKPDSAYEKVVRSQAIIDARDKCKTVFETYKKAHQMPTW